MKWGLFLTVLAFGLNSFAAGTVLLKTQRTVGFAPPEYRGTFVVQVLTSGEVEAVNNKNQTTKIATLSAEAVKSLTSKIAKLKVEALQGEDGPGCADAPSEKNVVVKSGKEVVIKQTLACKTKEMYSASELNYVVDALDQISGVVTSK